MTIKHAAYCIYSSPEACKQVYSVVVESTPWPSIMIVVTMNGIDYECKTARRNGRQHDATDDGTMRQAMRPIEKPIEIHVTRRVMARRNGRRHDATARCDRRRCDGRRQDASGDATARRGAHLASLEHHTIYLCFSVRRARLASAMLNSVALRAVQYFTCASLPCYSNALLMTQAQCLQFPRDGVAQQRLNLTQ